MTRVAGRLARARRAAGFIVTFAAVTLSAVTGAGAQTVAPPDLAGEQFLAAGSTFQTDPDAVVTTSYSCDDNGGTATVVATGPAAGPYPGTFHEEATLTMGAPDESGRRSLLSYEATFSIDSAVGQVEGTKTFDPSIAPLWFDTVEAACIEDSGAWFINEIHALTPQLAYTAIVTTADGTFVDYGTATLFYSTFLVTEGPQAGITVDGFEERFRSDGVAPVLAAPTDIEQCMDGGYATFGFKNQGECVRFVVTGKR